MNAKEMFEELGYKQTTTHINMRMTKLQYRKGDYRHLPSNYINFHYKGTYSAQIKGGITPQLHQAIHQQMKELGWIE